MPTDRHRTEAVPIISPMVLLLMVWMMKPLNEAKPNLYHLRTLPFPPVRRFFAAGETDGRSEILSN